MRAFIEKTLYSALGIIIFLPSYYLLRLLFETWLDYKLWSFLIDQFSVFGLGFNYTDVVYFTFGFASCIAGFVDVARISQLTHSVQDRETRQPQSLITSKYYARARNPMYGAFIIIQTGLFVSTRSIAGIAIAILFFFIQSISTHYEEKLLQSQFTDEYDKYREKVVERFFLPHQWIFVRTFIIITAAGAVSQVISRFIK